MAAEHLQGKLAKVQQALVEGCGLELVLGKLLEPRLGRLAEAKVLEIEEHSLLGEASKAAL